jgi:ribonucleoside-diphosphate reductase alpha chain
MTRKDAEVYSLQLEDFTVHCTGDHKIYTKRGWVKAYHLIENDEIYTDSGFKKFISCKLLNIQDVYDITVEDTHCFYANGILLHNCEIGFWPVLPNGESGFNSCNLTEVNGAFCTSKEDFLKVVKYASFLGTLQAGYNSFPYLGKTSEEIFKKEALLGISITGWMDNPELLFNEKTLKEGVNVARKTNQEIAKILGINPAARLTCTKPSGSASAVLSTGSGIHAQHSKKFLRRAQVNKKEFAGKVMKKKNPIAVQESVWSANNTDNVVSFPCEAPKNALVKKDLNAISFLEKIKYAYQHWVVPGTNKELGLNDGVTHNISCTVNIAPDEWYKVRDYIYENRNYFSGVSLLSTSGDLDYNQAPFVEVLTPIELVERYGDGVPMASGLIVDGLHAFNNLWTACDAVLGVGEKLEAKEEPVEPKKPRKSKDISEKQYANILANYAIDLNLFYQEKGDYETLNLKKDWVRRAKQFADRYFGGDLKQMTYCLKHVSIWKDWLDIRREWKEIDWSTIKENSQEFVDADTMGAVACSGGSCEKL